MASNLRRMMTVAPALMLAVLTLPGTAQAVPLCTIFGTPGADTILGTPGNDVICGLGGNDVLKGGGGNDFLRGGGGADTLIGREGDDTFDGGSGPRDMIDMRGAPGPVVGDMGAGTITGFGSDTIGAGVEGITGATYGDTLTGNAGNNKLVGGAGIDTITDTAGGSDKLIGQTGNDIINGVDSTVGNDIVSGGDDTDTCSADLGDSVLTCEA